MALLSLKRLGEAPSTEINQRILAQLVEMVTLQPVAADPEECERFIAQVHRIQDEVAADASTDQILAAVRAIGGALATHQEVVSNLFRHQGSELQNMVCRQTDTLNSMMRMASNVSARNLESIAMQLKDACALDDIQVLRIRLADCLKSLRDEAERQNTEIQSNLGILQRQLEDTKQRASRHRISAQIDRVTGLGDRAAAEIAIQESANTPDTRYVLIGVLGKMQGINARFGYAVGDEVLCDFVAHAARQVSGNPTFYRWSGPALIAILERTEPLHVIRSEVSRFAEAPLVKHLVSRQQNALISILASWLVIPLQPPASDLIASIDTFVSAQTCMK